MSGLERTFEPRRLEVINGAGGRRVWSADARAAILEETLVPGAVVSAVARRHGLTPQQVFGWRREARRALEAVQESTPLRFVPAVVVAPTSEPATVPPPAAQRSRGSRQRGSAAGIELEVCGVAVRIGSGASEAQIAMVIRALKATA